MALFPFQSLNNCVEVKMPKCAVKECKNHSTTMKKTDGVSYFHFPQNEIRREEWRRIIARDRQDEFYKPNNSSVICSKHFSTDDVYMTNKGLLRIKNTALPILRIKNPCSGDAIGGKFQSQCLSEAIEKVVIKRSGSPCTSTSSESILDTPHVSALKKELMLCKKRILTQNKTINNLKRVNKRLKNKNATLKNILMALRKHRC